MVGLGRTTVALSILLLASADSAETHRLRRLRKSSAEVSAVSTEHKSESSDFLVEELFDENNAMIWRNLVLSFSFPVCGPSVPPFEIDDSVDIGAVTEAGDSDQNDPWAYTVRGNGRVGCDDDTDGTCPDALHFAYKKISGNFKIQTKVCKTPPSESEGISGRSGLMIRDSLDPGAKHSFNGYTPNSVSYNPSTRKELNGPVAVSDIAVPDVYCWWMIMDRTGNEITTNYTESNQGDMGPEDCVVPDFAAQWVTLKETINMPDEVLVGLAVTSYEDDPELDEDPVNDGLAETNFRHIQLTQ